MTDPKCFDPECTGHALACPAGTPSTAPVPAEDDWDGYGAVATVLRDLIARMDSAAERLYDLAAGTGNPMGRLHHKGNGVMLARSYVEEALRAELEHTAEHARRCHRPERAS